MERSYLQAVRSSPVSLGSALEVTSQIWGGESQEGRADCAFSSSSLLPLQLSWTKTGRSGLCSVCLPTPVSSQQRM